MSDDTMKLRVPAQVKAWLKARAHENSRSQNRELAHILKTIMEAEHAVECGSMLDRREDCVSKCVKAA